MRNIIRIPTVLPTMFLLCAMYSVFSLLHAFVISKIRTCTSHYLALSNFLGEKINKKVILTQWSEFLPLVASIKQGAVMASFMMGVEVQDGNVHLSAHPDHGARIGFAADWADLRQRFCHNWITAPLQIPLSIIRIVW